MTTLSSPSATFSAPSPPSAISQQNLKTLQKHCRHQPSTVLSVKLVAKKEKLEETTHYGIEPQNEGKEGRTNIEAFRSRNWNLQFISKSLPKEERLTGYCPALHCSCFERYGTFRRIKDNFLPEKSNSATSFNKWIDSNWGLLFYKKVILLAGTLISYGAD